MTSTYAQKQKYFICLGRTGAIMRIDYLIMVKKTKGEKLRSVTKNMVQVCYLVSSIKTETLVKNDLYALIDVCYGAASEQTKENLIKKIYY